MRQIINGKAYDTSTAILVSEFVPEEIWAGGLCCESLYKKKNSEFFVLSQYEGGQKYHTIYPYDLSEAKQWIEQHANYMYETVFGKVEE